MVSGSYVKYIGTKSKYLNEIQVYKVDYVATCPCCKDKVLILHGFEFQISRCRFCNTLINANCFSATRFKEVFL